MNISEIFAHDVADASMRLDCLTVPGHQTSGPAAIRAEIILTHDRVPGSTPSSESGVRSARLEVCCDPTCPQADGWDHTHPVPNDPTGDAAMRPSKSDADLKLLEESVASFVAAVAELVGRSVSRGVPTTWDEAVGDCRMLEQMGAVESLIGAWGAADVRRWVLRASDAIHDIEAIARRHVARIPDDIDRLMTGDPVCLSHARIGDYGRAIWRGLAICRTCRDLMAQVCNPDERQKDPEWWPTTALLREHADMERTGRRVDYQRVRRDWIAGFPRRCSGA